MGRLSKYKILLILITFILLPVLYSNCSDIRIISGKTNSTLPLSDQPADKFDMETFGKIDTTCYPNTDQLGYLSLQLWPLSPPRNFIYQGQSYPILVAGNLTCANGKEVFDYSGANYTNEGAGSIFRTRRAYQTDLAFRIILPTTPGYLTLIYEGVLDTMPPTTILYSISRQAGYVDPTRPNSDEYCNGYEAAVTSDTGPTQKTPLCKLKPGLVYYFNALDLGSSNMEGYDPPGMDIRFKYEVIDCSKYAGKTIIPGNKAAYMCP